MDNYVFPIADQNIKVIEAGPENSVDIARIQKDGWLTAYPNEERGITRELILTKDFDSVEKLAWGAERIRTQVGTKVWMAYRGDAAVGFCIASLGELENKFAALYVASGHRRVGVGSRLMITALNWLGREKDVGLSVVCYNDNAIRFYEKHGFERGGPFLCADPDFPNGMVLPEIEMRLRAEAPRAA